MASQEGQQQIEAFVHETMEMIRQIQPFVRALVEQPDREDLVLKITDSCFRLFHFVKGKGTVLGLHHLAAPAEAMEYMLDRVKSGTLLFSPRNIGLLAEVCTFIEQGMDLVLAEKGDARLAGSAGALASAILHSTAKRDECSGEGTGASLPLDMRESYLWEIDNLLIKAEQECVLWDFIALDLERVADLCRLLHRLKQNFSLYDFCEQERMCIALESTLNRYVQGEFFQTEYPERVFLRSIDALRAAMTSFSLTDDPAVPDLEHHLTAIQGLMRQPIGELLIQAGLVDSAMISHALEVQRSSTDGQAPRLGEVLVAMGEVTPEQVRDVLQEQHNKRLRTAEAEIALGSSGPVGVKGSSATSPSHEIRIDGRKIERMALVVEQLMAMRLPGNHVSLLGELQSLLLSCRRDAFSSLVGRLQRTVHDLAIDGNKRINFVVEGIEVLQELREAVVFADFLLHLLRNGIEHGLESSEERLRVGKKKTGKLHLSAMRHGEEIWVSVEDDGRGFDFETIAAMLVKRGLMTAESAGLMTNRERLELLFRGSSASEDAEQAVANRGCGLALVHGMLLERKGKITVTTRSGKGSCVTLRVPRTH